MERVKKALEDAVKALETASSLETLEEIRVTYLSKKGVFAEFMTELKNIEQTQRPLFGKVVNESKVTVEQVLDHKKELLLKEALDAKLAEEKMDMTLPGLSFNKGSNHPLSQVIEDVEDFFIGQGFMIEEGPEIESDLYNFEMMNLAKDHPARDMQDSFYIDPNTLLRTHTSPVQARAMLKAQGADLSIICPGKVYRRDEDDATHSHQFMQIEGLVIGKNISFAQLKQTLLNLAQHLFGKDREIRVRPSYFPFTEPSVEVDVSYLKKDGQKGYLEILGAGLVHPNVLKMGGYDPEKVSGFAFGIGVERIAILKYKVDDIRHFYTNDLRFLKQFKGVLS